MIKRDREPGGGGRKPKRRRDVTCDEDQRGYRVVDDQRGAIRGRDLSRTPWVYVCVRVSAAINSRVIDGAISGATRGRILGVCRSVELEIWIVNGLNLELVLAV